MENKIYKVRIWDKLNKEMYLNINPFSSVDKTSDGFCFARYKFILESFQSTPTKKDLIVMQYTGVKDKNGKEICCGDIVKVILDIEMSKKDKAQIIWYDGGFEARAINKKFRVQLSKYYTKNCEIIGNIYENENLLNNN